MLEAVQLATQQIDKLTATAVSKITQNVPGHQDLPQSQLTNFVHNIYQVQFRYLEETDTEKWKQFCQATVAERARQGIRYFSVVQTFEITLEVLNAFFQEALQNCQELDGLDSVAALKRLERRLQGLKMLTVSTVIASGVRDIRTM